MFQKYHWNFTHTHTHAHAHAHTHFNNFNRIKNLHNKARNPCTRPHHLPKQVQATRSEHENQPHPLSHIRPTKSSFMRSAHPAPTAMLSICTHTVPLPLSQTHTSTHTHTHTHAHTRTSMHAICSKQSEKKAYLLFPKLSCWGLCCEQLFLLLVPLQRIQAQPDLVLRIPRVYRDESFFFSFFFPVWFCIKTCLISFHCRTCFYLLQTLWQFRKHCDFEGTGGQKVWTPLNMTSDEALS